MDDFGNVAGVGCCLLTLCILFRMLVARFAGTKGVERLAATATSPSRRTRLIRPIPLPNDYSTTQDSSVKPFKMLRGAVQEHEQKAAAKAPSSKAAFFGSSPPTTSSQQQGSQSTTPSYRNPLKPAESSALNGARAFLPPHRATNGIKRTASGLAKALDGTFEEGPGSRQNPISLDGRTSSKGFQVTQTDFIDENDFDSDVDLDIEEPIAKNVPSYPTLPEQTRQSSAIAPLVYPTLPRHQQAQPSFSRNVGPAYEPFGSLSQGKAPQSSAPIPWSSSPAEHHNAAISPSKSKAQIQDHAFKPLARTSATAQALQNGPPPPQPEARPTKRRSLPWHEEEEMDQKPAHDRRQQESKANRFVDATPAGKGAQKSAYPWNTTASAVKDQQKKHRDETKKAIKHNEGDEESIGKAKSAREQPARVFLSEEQQHVLDLVIAKKKSVFFTGSAGTGKSVLMREIISSLRRVHKREPDRVAVTASTGLAACNIGGVTLHSFAGIGLGKEEAPDLVKKIKKNQKAKHRWMRTKILIVDEVSMVDGDLFDKLEAIARQLRANGRPFGGIQLVITGDFFQLPPVPDYGKVAKFAFDAATWGPTIDHTIGLHHVFRQKDPGKPSPFAQHPYTRLTLAVFAGMLNEMREGRLQQSSVDAFRKLNRPLKFEDELEATELFPTRNEVDNANFTRLKMLQGKEFIFEARDGGAIVDKPQRDKLLSNCMAPENIILKKGAQVMLIKNVDESLVNGSIGRVIGFMDEKKFDSYQAAETDSHDVIPSQSNGDNPQSRILDSITTIRQWPVVRFSIADGTSRDLLCQPESWKVELPNGEVQASRNQVPLILAWALSIHKAQGQTLERVKVDLGKVFEKGQAYVALSRATSMAGLQVLRFDPKKVNAHDKVRNFYANLSRVELEVKASGKGKEAKKNGVNARDYEQKFVGDEWDEFA